MKRLVLVSLLLTSCSSVQITDDNNNLKDINTVTSKRIKIGNLFKNCEIYSKSLLQYDDSLKGKPARNDGSLELWFW